MNSEDEEKTPDDAISKHDSPWLYRGVPITDNDIGDAFGFIYIITNLKTGRRYIGRKYFTKAKTLPPLKGKTRKRRSRVDSGWRDYWGSNKVLQEEVAINGTEGYRREIVRLCATRSECSYYETSMLFQHDVLLYPARFYNDWVTCRIHATHMNPKKKARN